MSQSLYQQGNDSNPIMKVYKVNEKGGLNPFINKVTILTLVEVVRRKWEEARLNPFINKATILTEWFIAASLIFYKSQSFYQQGNDSNFSECVSSSEETWVSIPL